MNEHCKKMKTEYLKIIPTLGVVEDNEIELASKLFEFKIFQKGDCIIKPGTNSHNIYLYVNRKRNSKYA